MLLPGNYFDFDLIIANRIIYEIDTSHMITVLLTQYWESRSPAYSITELVF